MFRLSAFHQDAEIAGAGRAGTEAVIGVRTRVRQTADIGLLSVLGNRPDYRGTLYLVASVRFSVDWGVIMSDGAVIDSPVVGAVSGLESAIDQLGEVSLTALSDEDCVRLVDRLEVASRRLQSAGLPVLREVVVRRAIRNSGAPRRLRC